jgi:hypothetical protein
MREKPAPETLSHWRGEVECAVADLDHARHHLADVRQELAEVACPWQPGDFVRQAVATVPETPRDHRYRVEKVHPGDPDPTVATDWTLEVRDRVGNRFIFAESVALAPAEPWEESQG